MTVVAAQSNVTFDFPKQRRATVLAVSRVIFLGMTTHQQTWVKVNAQVDTGIAEIIEMLNSIPGLRTIDSCQGRPGADGFPAHIYFYYGDWQEVCRFGFDTLRTALDEINTELAVTIFNHSDPLGKLSFSPEATSRVTTALKRLMNCPAPAP